MGTIRIILAICVLLFHCPRGVIPVFFHPSLAVQCFYVISGFLIQYVIGIYKTRGGIHWRSHFYKSRLFRLFPLYWLFAALPLICFGSPILKELWNGDQFFSIGLYTFNNLFIIGQDILRLITFAPSTGDFGLIPPNHPTKFGGFPEGYTVGNALTIMGQSWSLAIELQFYLLAPFILFCRSRLLIAIILFSIATRYGFASHGYKFHSFTNAVFPNEIGIFMLGALACRFYQHWLATGAYRNLHLRGKHITISDRMMVNMGLLAWLFTLFYYYKGWHKFPPGGGWNVGLFAVPYGWWGAIIVTALTMPFIFHSLKHNKIDRFVGDMSYPVYINHFFFINLISRMHVPEEWQVVYVLALSIISAIVLHLCIERPIDAMRHRYYRKKREVQS